MSRICKRIQIAGNFCFWFQCDVNMFSHSVYNDKWYILKSKNTLIYWQEHPYIVNIFLSIRAVWNRIVIDLYFTSCMYSVFHGLLTRYVKLRVVQAPGMPGTFSPSTRVRDSNMHHGTCVTHVPWCMPGSLTTGFLWNRWQGKRSWHSRRMRNPQFYVSVKRPIDMALLCAVLLSLYY